MDQTETRPHMANCICDGGAYEVKANPFIVNEDCQIHSAPNPLDCYLCGREGHKGFVLKRHGPWSGRHRCSNETACALRIYRAMRADL